jgi:uncharacterized protein YciI
MVESLIKGHVENLRDLHSRGVLFICGPLKGTDKKALLIFNANSREEVEWINPVWEVII